MKKAILCSFVLVVVAFAGRMHLLETYQDGVLETDKSEVIDTILLELEFSVDEDCYAVFSSGGSHEVGYAWWYVLDGDSLSHTTRKVSPTTVEQTLDQTYMCFLGFGPHTMQLRWRNTPSYNCSVRDARLQALIFLPDTGNAVAEQPTSDAEPLPNSPSLISKGPFVHVAGATELVDATGRVIEGAIENDKVFISNLSTGTYFARDGERTIVKIVKVD